MTGEALTVREVAARLRVSVATVRRRIASGDLEAVKIGPRTLRVTPAALAAYTARNATGQGWGRDAPAHT